MRWSLVERGGEAPDDGRPDDFVQSVGRAMRVLEVVGRHPGLPVKAIARQCDLNISTSYHLVRTLAYEGYLVRLPDGTYVIGETVARRFHDLVTTLERPPEAGVVLRQLSDRVGLSSYLGLLQDGRVTVVEVAEAAGSPYLEDFEVGLDVARARDRAREGAAGGDAAARAAPVPDVPRAAPVHHPHPHRPGGARGGARRRRRGTARCSEHGEFRDGVSCTASLVPRRTADDPAWAVVVAVADEDVPAPVAAEVGLAAADLAGYSSSSS